MRPRYGSVAPTQLANAIAIRVGVNHACALRSTGTVSCWGRNANGQLGDDTNAGRPDAGGVVLGLTAVTGLAAGNGHTCALDAGGIG